MRPMRRVTTKMSKPQSQCSTAETPNSKDMMSPDTIGQECVSHPDKRVSDSVGGDECEEREGNTCIEESENEILVRPKTKKVYVTRKRKLVIKNKNKKKQN